MATELPGIKALRRKLHNADFRSGFPSDGFSGCFSSFAEAGRNAPSGPVGYDHERMTNFYFGTNGSLFVPMDPNDYAVLFWLRPLIKDAKHLIDLGGYFGMAYHNYRKYLNYPPDFTWTVCDVPAVVRSGAAIALREGMDQLRFTTNHTDADGADILLAAGSLQYMDTGALQRIIGSIRNPPRHVLVQRTPLHPKRSFFTLQVMAIPNNPAFCAYTVAERGSFISGIEDMVYELVDSWSQPRVLDVPFHPYRHLFRTVFSACDAI